MVKEQVLVFIPVKNEEKTIRKVIDEISEVYPSWDIIVIDDKSDDATVEEVKKTKAKVIPLLINTIGLGSVLIAFMIAKRKKYDYLVKIDGDGQQEVNILKSLLDAMKENNADIAIGSRYVRKQKETDSFIKVFGRVMSSALVNFKLKGKNKISDCTSGVRAWNAKSIAVLGNTYYNQTLVHNSIFWIEEAIIASRNDLKICEIPAFYHKREHGKSKSFSLTSMIVFPLRLLTVLIS